MGSILTIASSKGGSGKSTLAVLLAICLGSRGRSVALIDADPNGTVSDWHATNYDGPPIRSIAETGPDALVRHAYDAAESADVIVDTAGFGNVAAAHAMAACDAVLIPCIADRGSVREAMRTHAKAAELATAAKRVIPCRVVFSQWTPRGLAEAAAMDDIATAGIDSLNTKVPALAAYKQLTFTGTLPPGRAQDVGFALVDELIRLGMIGRAKAQKGKR